MLNLAQFVDGSSDELTVDELQKLYHIADSDGDVLALELIVKELGKREWQD